MNSLTWACFSFRLAYVASQQSVLLSVYHLRNKFIDIFAISINNQFRKRRSYNSQICRQILAHTGFKQLPSIRLGQNPIGIFDDYSAFQFVPLSVYELLTLSTLGSLYRIKDSLHIQDSNSYNAYRGILN